MAKQYEDRKYPKGKKEYIAWLGMKARCNNPNCRGYKWYGARGIKVCDRWNKSFDAFLEDMGRAPSPDHSLDRTDNDGNYEPGNVRWATRDVQRLNQRRRSIRMGRKSPLGGRAQMAENWEYAVEDD